MTFPNLYVPGGKARRIPPDGFSELLFNAGGAVATGNVSDASEIRYRSPICVQEWYEEYEVWNPGELHCSLSTFVRVYNSNWASILKIRRHGVHATCHQCAQWREYRKFAKNKVDFDAVKSGQEDHLHGTYMDRAVSDRLELLGEQSTKEGEITLSNSSILDCCGDGALSLIHI